MLSGQSLLHCSAHHQGSEHATHHDAQHLSMSSSSTTTRHSSSDKKLVLRSEQLPWASLPAWLDLTNSGQNNQVPIKSQSKQSSPKKIAAECSRYSYHVEHAAYFPFYFGVCCNLAARMPWIEANKKTIENMSKFIRHPWKSVKTLFFELPLQKAEIIGGGAWNSSCVVCSEAPDFAVPGFHPSYFRTSPTSSRGNKNSTSLFTSSKPNKTHESSQ